MPTLGEQKALLFLGAVALLGGAVRLLGGGDPVPEPTSGERVGLEAQLAATDSAAEQRRAERAGKKDRRRSASSNTRSGRQKQDTAATASGLPMPGSRRPTPIDVDRASVDELDALPGVGPALAARIVADRNARGAFGTLDALDAVPGVGPALIKRLAPHVTFSGPPRPSTANGSGGGVRASGRVVGLIGGRP